MIYQTLGGPVARHHWDILLLVSNWSQNFYQCSVGIDIFFSRFRHKHHGHFNTEQGIKSRHLPWLFRPRGPCAIRSLCWNVPMPKHPWIVSTNVPLAEISPCQMFHSHNVPLPEQPCMGLKGTCAEPSPKKKCLSQAIIFEVKKLNKFILRIQNESLEL